MGKRKTDDSEVSLNKRRRPDRISVFHSSTPEEHNILEESNVEKEESNVLVSNQQWGLYIDDVIQSEWWISPSSLFNFMMKDPLLDWLKGRPVRDNEKVFDVRSLELNPSSLEFNSNEQEPIEPIEMDEPASDANFRDYILGKGLEFESKVVGYLFNKYKNNVRQVSFNKDDIKLRSKYNETIELMKGGCPIIVQAVLHDMDNALFGCADLLVRSDWLGVIIKEFNDSDKNIKHKAIGIGKKNFHYRVIDIKFKTLGLKADGIGLLNAGTIPACKAQVMIYNRIIGKIQKYEPDECYLLGRGYKYSSKDEVYTSNNCFDRLGTIFPHSSDDCYNDRIAAGIKWKRDLKIDGEKWQILPKPSRIELYPNMNNHYDFPYHSLKTELANKINDITTLWYCGVKNREFAFKKGITSWRDKKCSAKLLGVNGPKIGSILQKMLNLNHGVYGNALIIPEKIKNNWYNWRSKHQRLEFYIDFENFNSIIDNFSTFPLKTNIGEFIFMAGVGYINHDKEWTYKCFYAKEITLNAEHDMFDELHKYVAGICKKWKTKDPVFYHWGNAEKHLYEKMIERHSSFLRNKKWIPPKFCDFVNIMKAEPILIKGVMSFGLKDVGNGMNKLGLIDLSWPADINGQDAMIQSLYMYQFSDASENNDTSENNDERELDSNPKFKDIIDYNEIDCKMMCEIINRLRL